NSVFYDNISEPCTFTNNTLDKRIQGNSVEFADRGNFSYYDSTARRVWWGRDWYGTDINSNCVYVWGTDRNTSAYWAYMAPSDVQIAGIVLGRGGSNAAARFQYHHGDGTKNWRLVIENATAYRWYASGF